jgi:hypothetical protein
MAALPRRRVRSRDPSRPSRCSPAGLVLVQDSSGPLICSGSDSDSREKSISKMKDSRESFALKSGQGSEGRGASDHSGHRWEDVQLSHDKPIVSTIRYQQLPFCSDITELHLFNVNIAKFGNEDRVHVYPQADTPPPPLLLHEQIGPCIHT